MFPFIFLLPILAFGQPQTESDAEQCRGEYFKMMSCVRNITIFSKIDDSPGRKSNRPLQEELEHVIDCQFQFGKWNCSSTNLLLQYIVIKANALRVFNDFIEPCSRNIEASEEHRISEICGQPIQEDECFRVTQDQVKCFYEESKKLSGCEHLQFGHLTHSIWAYEVCCTMAKQLGMEFQAIGLDKNSRRSQNFGFF